MPEAPYQGYSPNARFLQGDVPGNESIKARVGNAVGVSIATHVAIVAILIIIATQVPSYSRRSLSISTCPTSSGRRSKSRARRWRRQRQVQSPTESRDAGQGEDDGPGEEAGRHHARSSEAEPKPDSSPDVPAQQVSSGPGAAGTSQALPSAITPSQGMGTGGGAARAGTGIGPGQALTARAAALGVALSQERRHRALLTKWSELHGRGHAGEFRAW